jgi:hypothetical protein
MRKPVCSAGLAGSFAALLPLVASAQLLATLGAGGGTSTLIELDPATGAQIRTIGNVGYLVNGMTYDATTNTLYATTSTNSASHPDGLITINMTTGAGTPIGSGAGQLVNVPAVNSLGQLYGWTEQSDDLVLWNKAAGTITVPGDSGVGTAEQSLAFDNNNVLYLINYTSNVYTIDTATGAATLQGSIPNLGANGIAHHGDFHPGTNLLYALDATADYGSTRNLLVVNVATRQVVQTIPTVNSLHTLAFVGAVTPRTGPVQVPVDNPLALLALASVIAGLGAAYQRRRNRS